MLETAKETPTMDEEAAQREGSKPEELVLHKEYAG